MRSRVVTASTTVKTYVHSEPIPDEPVYDSENLEQMLCAAEADLLSVLPHVESYFYAGIESGTLPYILIANTNFSPFLVNVIRTFNPADLGNEDAVMFICKCLHVFKMMTSDEKTNWMFARLCSDPDFYTNLIAFICSQNPLVANFSLSVMENTLVTDNEVQVFQILWELGFYHSTMWETIMSMDGDVQVSAANVVRASIPWMMSDSDEEHLQGYLESFFGITSVLFQSPFTDAVRAGIANLAYIIKKSSDEQRILYKCFNFTPLLQQAMELFENDELHGALVVLFQRIIKCDTEEITHALCSGGLFDCLYAVLRSTSDDDMREVISDTISMALVTNPEYPRVILESGIFDYVCSELVDLDNNCKSMVIGIITDMFCCYNDPEIMVAVASRSLPILCEFLEDANVEQARDIITSFSHLKVTEAPEVPEFMEYIKEQCYDTLYDIAYNDHIPDDNGDLLTAARVFVSELIEEELEQKEKEKERDL